MDPQLATLFVAIGGFVSGALSLYAGRKQRKANVKAEEANAAATISGGFKILFDSLENRVKHLEGENKELRALVKMLRDTVENINLERKVERAGYEKKIEELTNKIHDLEQGLTNGNGAG